MMRVGVLDRSRLSRVTVRLDEQPNSRGEARRTDVIVADPADRAAPQAFLIEQSPESIASAHFHDGNQFQVVVAGGGLLGKHPVRPYTVHYASRHTGYGPLVAGTEGLSYLTLRARPGCPPIWLPGQKHLMQPGPRCNIESPPSDADGTADRLARKAVSVETLLTPRDEGIAAWMLRIPPGERAMPPLHPKSGGQYRVVAGGSMQAEGRVVGHLACIFVPGPESDTAITSGPEGLDVLVLQFPEEPVPA